MNIELTEDQAHALQMALGIVVKSGNPAILAQDHRITVLSARKIIELAEHVEGVLNENGIY